MFTGLIKDIGTIKSISHNTEGAKLCVETKLANEIAIDDSIATNGVCLTATRVGSDFFEAQCVRVTLEKSSLKSLRVGSKVNLELATKASERLGGHIVQGHVNGLAKLQRQQKYGNNIELWFKADKELMPYMVAEGSIAIDGISLTIAKLQDATTEFCVSVIPHTLTSTNLGLKQSGDTVNIEVDIIAKYVERLLNYKNENTSLSMERLAQLGY